MPAFIFTRGFKYLIIDNISLIIKSVCLHLVLLLFVPTPFSRHW